MMMSNVTKEKQLVKGMHLIGGGKRGALTSDMKRKRKAIEGDENSGNTKLF